MKQTLTTPGGLSTVLIMTGAWVLMLGLLATLPLGAMLGSLFSSQRSAGGPMLLLLAGLAAISGIFYPITHLPVFLQWTGQVFPMYWLGLGMRSALLPNAMAAAQPRSPKTVYPVFPALCHRRPGLSRLGGESQFWE